MRKYAVIIFVFLVLLMSTLHLNSSPIKTIGLPPEIVQELSVPAFIEAEAEAGDDIKLTFSKEDFFYNSTINVEIIASNPDAIIYYTTDGSEPTSECKKYTEPITISSGRRVKAVVIKAFAFAEGSTSSTYAHTYFMGAGSRFNTLVFSLSIDSEHLYDYDTGIFVEGRLRDEFEAQNKGQEIIPTDPANYNWRGMEGERPVYVEVFTPEGKRVIAQAAGLRVSGGWSRAANQKSIRLIARKEYEPEDGKFHYSFFDGDVRDDGDGTPITEYDTLILRNGANDRDFGMLRNEVASYLAADAGFRVVTPVRAAAVFINGEYYGFAWLQVSINEQYLQDIYSAPTKEFEIVGDGEQWLNTEEEEAKASLEQVNSYAYKDLCDDTLFAELEALVDIDNLMLYYAYQIYMGNDDWPHNNLKRWRYIGTGEDGDAPELDGRWRYIMYDVDWTLGLYGDDYTKPSFQAALVGDDKRSPLLSSILKRPDMAQRFTTILCDLAGVVTKDAVQGYINRFYEEAEHELDAAFKANKFSDWVSVKTVKDNHMNMLAFANNRAAYIYSSLQSYFGYDDSFYTVEVDGADAIIGTQRLKSAKYFDALDVSVSPLLADNEVFNYWELNGEKIYEPTITVSSADAENGVVALSLVTRTELPTLVISSAYTSSRRNGCVLTNTQDKPVSTEGYYLSDSRDDLQRWALPSSTIATGESIVLAGKGSNDINDLLKIQMGFKVKKGRVLYLSNSDGDVIHKLVVTTE